MRAADRVVIVRTAAEMFTILCQIFRNAGNAWLAQSTLRILIVSPKPNGKAMSLDKLPEFRCPSFRVRTIGSVRNGTTSRRKAHSNLQARRYRANAFRHFAQESGAGFQSSAIIPH